MVIVTAKVKIQADKVEEFLEAVRVMKPQVMRDPGAIEYSLHRSIDDPDTFIFYERYEDEKAFVYHLSTDHFRTLEAAIDPLMAVPGDIGKWVQAL